MRDKLEDIWDWLRVYAVAPFVFVWFVLCISGVALKALFEGRPVRQTLIDYQVTYRMAKDQEVLNAINKARESLDKVKDLDHKEEITKALDQIEKEVFESDVI